MTQVKKDPNTFKFEKELREFNGIHRSWDNKIKHFIQSCSTKTPKEIHKLLMKNQMKMPNEMREIMKTKKPVKELLLEWKKISDTSYDKKKSELMQVYNIKEEETEKPEVKA